MKDNKKVIYWLLTGCTLIFIMVIVGGITRLTHSGLSISNYKLISGTIPPTNALHGMRPLTYTNNTQNIKNLTIT